MYEVFVWVPARGWKSVHKFKRARLAYILAGQLEPLEVKVCKVRRGCRVEVWYGGRVCMVNHELEPVTNTLGLLAELAVSEE